MKKRVTITVFGLLFTAAGVLALGAALYGDTWHFGSAAICVVIALLEMLLPEGNKVSDKLGIKPLDEFTDEYNRDDE